MLLDQISVTLSTMDYIGNTIFTNPTTIIPICIVLILLRSWITNYENTLPIDNNNGANSMYSILIECKD